MKLYCKRCNHSFEREKIPKLCPYCSAGGYIGKQKSSQDILNEVAEESKVIEQSKEKRR